MTDAGKRLIAAAEEARETARAHARIAELEAALRKTESVAKDQTGHNLPQVTRLAQRIAAIARAALGEKKDGTA